MAIIAWRAARHIRNVQTRSAGIEYIARVVCRREIDEARRRIIRKHRKYFYQPSQQYIEAKTTFFKPKLVKYATKYNGSITNEGDWERHFHNIAL